MLPRRISRRLFSLIIIFSIAIVSIVHAAPSSPCNDGMSVLRQDNYITETLVNLSETPLEIALSHKTGDIYYITYNPYNATLEKVLNVFVKAENKHEKIHTNGTLQTMALDNIRGKLYLAFKSGLKEFDVNTKVTTNISSAKHNIIKLFVKGRQIYALCAFPDLHTYIISFTPPYNINCRTLIAACQDDKQIFNFVVDSHEAIYIQTLDTQYNVILKVIKEPYCEKYYSGHIVFSNMAGDKHGNVFGVSSNAIYRLYSNQTEPRLVTRLNETNETIIGSAPPTFDENNNIVIVNTKNNMKVIVVKPKMYPETENYRRFKS